MLYYNYNTRVICDAAGDPVSDTPELYYTTKPTWTIKVLGNPDFSQIVTMRAAVDVDFDANTEVMCRTLSEGISRVDNEFKVDLNTLTTRFFDQVNGKDPISAKFELVGINAAGDSSFYLIFPILVGTTLDPDLPITELPAPELAADKAYVEARLAAGYERQFSIDAITWHDAPATENDKYYRDRHYLLNRMDPWTAATPLSALAANGLSAYQSSQSSMMFQGTPLEQWLELASRRPRTLQPINRAIYWLSRAILNQWLDDLKGNPAPPGQPTNFDATGELHRARRVQ